MIAHSPHLVRSGDIDTTTVGALLAHPRFASLAGEALAIELWKFVCERFYHWFPPLDAHFEREFLTDPVMLINSYGFAICGTASNLLATLCHDAGLPARNVSLPGHRVTEVYYDGSWHLFDADLKAFHRLHPPRHDTVASLADLVADHTLVTDQRHPSDPYYLSDRAPADAARAYVGSATTDHVVPSHWHSMDYALPPGSEIEYRYDNSGRWVCHEEYRTYFETYPNEPGPGGPAERLAPGRTYANGILRVRTERGREQVHVSSPHPFAGMPDPTFATLPRDGVVATVLLARDADAPLVLRLRAGPSHRWVEAARAGVEEATGGAWRVDLTPWTAGRTSFDLAVEGPADSIEVEAHFVCAPAALLTLRAGDNEIRLVTGDRFGLDSVTRHLDVHFARADAFGEAGLVLEEGVHDPASVALVRPAPDAPYRVVVPLQPPPGTEIAWVYAVAYVQSRSPGDDLTECDGDVLLEISSSRTGPWRELARWDLMSHPDGWHFGVEHTERLASPARECFLRYTARTGMKGVRVRTHSVSVGSGTSAKVEAELRWTEAGAERSLRHTFTREGGPLRVTCAAPVEMRSVILRSLPE